MTPYSNCKKCESENLLDRHNFGKSHDEYGGYLCTNCGYEYFRKKDDIVLPNIINPAKEQIKKTIRSKPVDTLQEEFKRLAEDKNVKRYNIIKNKLGIK